MTYAALQAEIARRLDQRTDLADVIFSFSQDRIQFWGAYFFYSSDVIDTSITTAPGQAFYNLPNNIRALRAIRLLLPGNNQGYTVTSAQVTLPIGTIPVGTTIGFTTAGTILVGGQVVQYTATTPNSFTGCTGGVGVILQGSGISQIQPSTTTTSPLTLPASTIPVVSTTGFLPSGTIALGGSAVTYASLSATTFNSCVGGSGAVPNGALVQQLFGIWISLYKIDYYRMIEADVISPSNQAQPTWWAQFNTQFRLYNVPDFAYPLELTGNNMPAPPVADSDDNFWTEDAANLIIQSTCAEVKMNYLDDAEGAQRFLMAQDRERHRLLKLTFNLSDPHRVRGWL